MFRRDIDLPAPSSGLNTETVCSSETLVSTYKSTRRHNPEDQHLHRCEDVKSHTVFCLQFGILFRIQSVAVVTLVSTHICWRNPTFFRKKATHASTSHPWLSSHRFTVVWFSGACEALNVVPPLVIRTLDKIFHNLLLALYPSFRSLTCTENGLCYWRNSTSIQPESQFVP
jgi:hypothetical protein